MTATITRTAPNAQKMDEAVKTAIAVADAFRRSALRWARRDPQGFSIWATTMLDQAGTAMLDQPGGPG